MSGKFLDAEKVAATQIGFNTIFNEALALAPNPAAEFANVIPTDRPTEQFNWLGTNPVLEKWVGERKIAKLRAYSYSIAVEKWANGLEVASDDLDDDRIGLYRPKIQALANEAMKHRLNRIIDYLLNGFATTAPYGACYDGAAFFSASHKDGDGPTQTNLMTATLDDSGAYTAAWQQMLELVDENGQPLGITPTHLVCGPSNRATARTLLLADRNANGSTNTDFGTCQLVVHPRLVGAHAAKWFLLDLSGALKPMILLVRREVEFRQVIGPDSAEKFLRDMLYFGADCRVGYGYGLWQLALGSNGTT